MSACVLGPIVKRGGAGRRTGVNERGAGSLLDLLREPLPLPLKHSGELLLLIVLEPPFVAHELKESDPGVFGIIAPAG